MGDRGATLRAEDAVDGEAGGALASPALGRTVDGQLVLGDDSDESYNNLSKSIIVFFPRVLPQLTVTSSHSGAGSHRSDRKQ
jgi:hypothetical protein